MPGRFSKYLSLVVSVIMHSIVFVFFYYASQHYNPDSNGYISLDIAEEPAGGGSGGNTMAAVPEPEEKISSTEKRTEEKIKLEEKKVPAEKSSTTGSQTSNQNGNGKGTPGSGTGTGNGTGKGGISLGIPIPKPPKEDVYLVAVDEMPEPVGGDEAIESKIIVPPTARQKGITGTVFVLAFVDEMGSVRKVLLTKGIGYGCDEAAMNAVSRTRFKPGKQNGIPVKVQVQVPVAIR